jgi:hypothetical protein
MNINQVFFLCHFSTCSSVGCSRWTELTDAMRFLARVAEEAHASTEFRLLNGPGPIVVGRGNDNGQAFAALNALFDQVGNAFV